jgi:hypothetical protein
MAIQITRPDVEALIQHRLDTGSFKDAEDLIFQALQSVEPAMDEPLKDARPLLSRIRDIWRDMPDEVRAKLPEDGASQIDHYVYGLPKR